MWASIVTVALTRGGGGADFDASGHIGDADTQCAW